MVEFALVITVMIPILLYSQYFSDLFHFRMKAQEINFFRAWEFSTRDMTSYDNNSAGTNPHFSQHLSKVDNIVETLYKDFDSAEDNTMNSDGYVTGALLMAKLNLTATPAKSYSPNLIAISEAVDNVFGGFSDSGSIIGDKLDKIEGTLNDLIGGYIEKIGFNVTQAGVTSQVTINYKNFLMPTQYLSDRNDNWQGGKLLNSGTDGDSQMTYTTPSFTVLVDPWYLSDGGNIEPKAGGYKKNNYTRQVSKMVWFGLPNMLADSGIGKVLNTLGNIPLLGDFLSAIAEPFTPAGARVASINMKNGDPGRYVKNGVLGSSQTTYYTNPYYLEAEKDATSNIKRDCYVAGICGDTDDDDNDKISYIYSLQNRRNYYMGYKKAQCYYGKLLDDECGN